MASISIDNHFAIGLGYGGNITIGKLGYGFSSVSGNIDDFNFANESFTIELNVYVASIVDQKVLVGIDSSDSEIYKIHLGADKKFKFDGPGVSLESSGSGTGEYAINTWYHIEIDKDSTTNKYYMYVDGNYIASAVSGTSISGITSLTLSTASGGINGYLDEIRVVKGFVLHNTTSNFTPPTEAYSDPTEASSFIISLGTSVGDHIISTGNSGTLIKDNTSIVVKDTASSSNITIKSDNIEKLKVEPALISVTGDTKVVGDLNLYTSGNNVTIDNSGDIYLASRVGIGITNPDSAIHLAGSATNAGIIHIGKELSSTPSAPSAGDGLNMYTKNDGFLHINSNTLSEVTLGRAMDNVTIVNSKMVISDSGSVANSMYVINDVNKVIINETGVGIGNTTPDDKLDVSGVIQSSKLLVNLSSGTEKLEVNGALKVSDSVGESSANGVIRFKNGELYGRKDSEWKVLTGAGNGIPNYVNKTALFNNNEVTISNIGNASNQITVSSTSGFSKGLTVYITDTSDNSLDRRYHNITDIVGNAMYIETNSSKVVSTGKVRLNYTDFTDTMVTQGNEIVLLPLSHSLTTGDHHIYINWTTKFNENPLSDQILKIYYKNGQFNTPPPPGTTILGGASAEGTLLTTIYLSNLVSDANTSSSSVFIRVPEGETHYLRWTRSSTQQYRWGNDVGEILLDNFDVNYTTPSNLSAFTDRIYKGSSSLKVVDNGSGSGTMKMKISGTEKVTLNSTSLGYGTNAPTQVLSLESANNSLIIANTTVSNGHSGLLLSTSSGNNVNIFMDDGDSQKTKFSFGADLSTQSNRETYTKVIIDQGGNVDATSFAPFTGSHLCISKFQFQNINDSIARNNLLEYEDKEGYIVRSTGEIYNINNNINQTIPSINESLPVVELTNKINDSASYGIISGINKNDKDLHRLVINSIGEGALMVTNYNGNINNGDYLTSSPIQGIAMKQNSDTLNSFTIGKSLTNESFENNTSSMQFNGITYKHKLVGCTYHCG